MINYYATIGGATVKIDEFQKDCWVYVVDPTEEEIQYLKEEREVDEGFIRSSLDEEETSRIEMEEEQRLVIIDAPVTQQEESGGLIYSTMPIGIVLHEDALFTITLKENSVLREFADGQVRGLDVALKNRFLLTILLRVASRFHQYLRQIDKITNYVEKQLHKSMRNKELIQLLDLQKSLVYFSTSLKADELTLEKILRGRIIKMYDEDEDLLEDVLIEIKQAIEMSNIYSNILTGTMDAFASVISNNLNIVMKVLASITILLAIPNIITSAYGMNVSGLPFPNFWFALLLIGVAVGITAFVLKKNDMM